MWQCAIQRPGLVTSRRMSTVSPARTSTVSFHTRFDSGTSSRAMTRKRPAPWMWNGWCIGWSLSIVLTRRIFTRSPTRNDQSMAWLALPVSWSTSFQIMFVASVRALISGMRSSHSSPSPLSWRAVATVVVVPCSAARCRDELHAALGQVRLGAATSGCIGQVQAAAARRG